MNFLFNVACVFHMECVFHVESVYFAYKECVLSVEQEGIPCDECGESVTHVTRLCYMWRLRVTCEACVLRLERVHCMKIIQITAHVYTVWTCDSVSFLKQGT